MVSLYRGILLLYLATVTFIPVHAQALRYHRVDDDLLKSRIALAQPGKEKRLEALSRLFEEAGCTGSNLVRQPIRGFRTPNIICTLPGTTPATVVIGAHFDCAEIGEGVADNWSGASLLPSLYESMAKSPRTLTFVFVGFTEEEAGLHGSDFFVRQWKKDKRPLPLAMLNLDTIGLSPAKVEVTRSDKRLTDALVRVAAAMKLPISGANTSQVGTSDSQEFAEAKVPVLDIHSVTQDTWKILHSPLDNQSAVQFGHYRDTYLLTTGFLTYLDAMQARAVQPPSGGN